MMSEILTDSECHYLGQLEVQQNSGGYRMSEH